MCMVFLMVYIYIYIYFIFLKKNEGATVSNVAYHVKTIHLTEGKRT